MKAGGHDGAVIPTGGHSEQSTDDEVGAIDYPSDDARCGAMILPREIAYKYTISFPLSSEGADPCGSLQARIDPGVLILVSGICVAPAQCPVDQGPQSVPQCPKCPRKWVVGLPGSWTRSSLAAQSV